jgi:hypothetical protein
MIEEVIYISAFNVKPDGTIEVRKTTDVTKDGAVLLHRIGARYSKSTTPLPMRYWALMAYYRTLASRCLGDGPCTCTRC